MTPHRQSGFSFVEVLIAVALTAILLTAIAASIEALMKSYKENESLTQATQAARYSLGRIMRDVRTAEDLQVTGGRLIIIPPDDGSGIQQVEYSLNNGALLYIRTVAGATASYPLVGGDSDIQVTAFALTPLTATRGTVSYTSSLTARLSLTADNMPFTTAATATLRRNQNY
jgi:prepilin-type N-terminal cleavage/methylation domain-containing protein